MENKLDVLGAPLTLVRCLRCGLVYQPGVVSDEALARWYAYMGERAENFADTALIRRRLDGQLAHLDRFKTHGDLLDVGCGGGTLLRAAERRGWRPHGVEVSASCAAALRPWLGDRLHHGDLADAPFAKASFDVVVLSEVLEHVTAPRPLLARIRSLLRPGGAVWITTPNRRGLAGRLLGDRWRVVGDEHLSYFTVDTLRAVLEDLGYDVASLWTSGFDLQALRDLLPRRSQPLPPSSAEVKPLERPCLGISPPAGDELRARLVSVGFDLVNRLASGTGLGDGLRAIAIRRAD